MQRASAAVIVLILLLAVPALAAGPLGGAPASSGQTVLVPAYSHVYQGVRDHPFLLNVTLSVRNADPDQAITLESVRYLDTEGNLVRECLPGPETLRPLATREVLVGEKDTAGGSGAKFLVRWSSQKPVTPPVVESVMIGTRDSQGISFTSPGRVVRER